MNCNKCGHRIFNAAHISNSHTLLQTGKSCPICGNWVEAPFVPACPMPPKVKPISEEHKEKIRQNFAKGRAAKIAASKAVKSVRTRMRKPLK